MASQIEMITKQMHKLGITKDADFARKIGVTPQVWNNWKKRGVIPANRAKKIAEVLKLNTDELLSPGEELAGVFRDTYNQQQQLDKLTALIDMECLAQALEALDYLEKKHTKMDDTRKRAEILLELYKINKENMDAGKQPIAPSNVVRLAKAFG